MQIKKFLTLIILGSLFYNQISLCMQQGKKEEYPLEEIVIDGSAKRNLCELPDEVLLFKVFGYLEDEEKKAIRFVNKKFNNIYNFGLYYLTNHEFKAKDILFDKKNKKSKKDFNSMISYIKELSKGLAKQSTSDYKERTLKISAKDKEFSATIGKNCKLSKKNIGKMVGDLKELRYGPSLRKRCKEEPNLRIACAGTTIGFFGLALLCLMFLGGIIVFCVVMENRISDCSSPDIYENTNSTMYEWCDRLCNSKSYEFCKFYNLTSSN
ncbi:hypothetical protein ACFLYA_01720 [Candidatus Dependentiae bacterium]